MESTEQLTLFAADSHDDRAKTSQSPASKQALTANAQDYGKNSVELLAKYDPNTRLWKTCQLSLVETEGDGLAEFSETWPRSGMTRNGIAYQLPPLVPLTEGIESGLLPTVRACSSISAVLNESRANHQFPNLETVIARLMLPTIGANEYIGSSAKRFR